MNRHLASVRGAAAMPGSGGVDFVRAVARRVVACLPLLGALMALAQAWYYLGHNAVGLRSNLIGRHYDWQETLTLQAMFVVAISVAVLAADEAVARGAKRGPAYGLAIVAGCTIASVAAAALCRALHWRPEAASDAYTHLALLEWTVVALVSATFGTVVYVSERAARSATELMQAAQVARALARRRAIESRLQAMQARVEPQFLFNALARVKAVYETDPAAAGGALDDLIAYLRAALPHLRESTSTMQQEVELARAYLAIVRSSGAGAPELQTRLPRGLLDQRLPTMVLLPLVDHALTVRRHAGASGGVLLLEARETRGMLHIALSDQRALPDVLPRTARPLDEIETRLRAVYGERARIISDAHPDGGLRIVIEMPLETPDLPDR